MRKHFVIASVIIMLSVAMTLYITIKPDSTDEKTETTQQPIYILSEYKGRLAVYEYNSPTPVSVYDIYTDTLPPKDTEILKSGIKIYTEKGLINIIEDYTS